MNPTLHTEGQIAMVKIKNFKVKILTLIEIEIENFIPDSKESIAETYTNSQNKHQIKQIKTHRI